MEAAPAAFSSAAPAAACFHVHDVDQSPPPRTRSRTPPVPRQRTRGGLDARTPPVPRRPESLGKREKEEALKWVLRTLPRVLEQMNRLEQQLRGMQSLVLEHDAEFMAAREPEVRAVIDRRCLDARTPPGQGS